MSNKNLIMKKCEKRFNGAYGENSKSQADIHRNRRQCTFGPYWVSVLTREILGFHGDVKSRFLASEAAY
jgi:hypothetical protein